MSLISLSLSLSLWTHRLTLTHHSHGLIHTSSLSTDSSSPISKSLYRFIHLINPTLNPQIRPQPTAQLTQHHRSNKNPRHKHNQPPNHHCYPATQAKKTQHHNHDPWPHQQWHPWPTAKLMTMPSSIAKPTNLTPQLTKTHITTRAQTHEPISQIHNPWPTIGNQSIDPRSHWCTNRSTIKPR